MAKKLTFMQIPVGANKKHIVTCGGEPWAGFDKLSQAKMYINMQKAKRNASGGPAHAAGKIWDIQSKG